MAEHHILCNREYRHEHEVLVHHPNARCHRIARATKVLHDVVEDDLAFVGDVIFALGCGRLFEGTAEQMWDSLSRIAAWPEMTTLYCAHEYTASNARFALSLDDRPEMKTHAEAIFAARERGQPTVPTTVEAERCFNPFLRAADAADFAARRAAKDGFKG